MGGSGPTLLAPVVRFFAWWRRELAALIPPVLRASERRQRLVLNVSGRRANLTLETASGVRLLDEFSLEPEEATALIRRHAKREAKAERVLRLGGQSGLRRRVELPEATEENLGEVLAFEMDRFTPFQAEDVYFSYRVVGRDSEAERIEVELDVAPRFAVDPILEIFAKAGVRPQRVEVANKGTEGGRRPNLMPELAVQPGARWRAQVVAVLALIFIALAATAAYLPLQQKREQLASLEEELADYRARAEEADRLREQLETLQAQQSYLVKKRAAMPLAVVLLREVTELLPDDTWLVSFSVADEDLTLSGYAPRATALISVLESSPYFEGIEFAAPVTLDPRTNQERFTLRGRIVQLQAPPAEREGTG
jgi:general secretion pathway protein L